MQGSSASLSPTMNESGHEIQRMALLFLGPSVCSSLFASVIRTQSQLRDGGHPMPSTNRMSSPEMSVGLAGGDGTVGREIGHLTDGLSRIVADSIDLARLEVGEVARTVADNAAPILVFGALTVVGYGLACVALAVALAPAIGSALGFLAVGCANALVGVTGVIVVRRRARDAIRRLLRLS